MAAGAPAKLSAHLQPVVVSVREFARLGAGGLAALLICAVLSAQAWGAAPPRRGTPAPAFSLPVIANGKGQLTLVSLRGHAVYLNFFASWCGQCKQEVPAIVSLSKEYARRNVVVVGIDELEPADTARRFVREFRMPYPIVLDDSGDVGGAYGLYGMPLSVFIAPDGTVVSYHEGQMSKAAIRTALQSLVIGDR